MSSFKRRRAATVLVAALLDGFGLDAEVVHDAQGLCVELVRHDETLVVVVVHDVLLGVWEPLLLR